MKSENKNNRTATKRVELGRSYDCVCNQQTEALLGGGWKNRDTHRKNAARVSRLRVDVFVGCVGLSSKRLFVSGFVQSATKPLLTWESSRIERMSLSFYSTNQVFLWSWGNAYVVLLLF